MPHHHLAAFASQTNPKRKDAALARGFERSAFQFWIERLTNHHSDLNQRREALITITELLAHGETCVQLIDLGVCEAFNHCLNDNDELLRERATSNMAMIVDVAGAKGCDRMLEDGVQKQLCTLLEDRSASVRSAAYDALVQWCARSAKAQLKLCSEAETVEQLLINSERAPPEHAVKALHLLRICLTGRNPNTTERMLRAGALPVLLRLIAADNMMVIEVATMVLALLCIEWEAKLDAIKLNAIPLLVNLLEKKCKVTTRTAAAAALMHISVEISGKAKAVEAGIVHALAASLDEDEDKLLVYCLQCIANIGESKAARNLLRSLALQIAELQNHNLEVVQRSAMLALRAVDFEVVGRQ